MIFVRILAIVCAAFLAVTSLSAQETAAPTHSSQTATELLQRMNKAFAELAYDGVFSYLNGNELASLRVVHKVVDGVQRERLVHLNGAPREIVRHGEKVSCIVMPGDDLLALEKSIPPGPFARAFVRQFDRINDTYMVGEFGEGRVAGRKATRVAVSPKDQHRYGYRLWLDQETALLLRSELVDHEGNRLEIFMFNQVRLGDEVTDDALAPQEAQGSMVSHLTLKPASPQWQPPPDADSLGTPASSAGGADTAVSEEAKVPAQWGTRWLPPGFEMASADLRNKPASGLAVNSLMYSDGLATFSIYVEPMPPKGAASMVSQNGATVAVTHKVNGANGYYLVTLVGEIPVPTAQEIIASVFQK